MKSKTCYFLQSKSCNFLLLINFYFCIFYLGDHCLWQDHESYFYFHIVSRRPIGDEDLSSIFSYWEIYCSLLLRVDVLCSYAIQILYILREIKKKTTLILLFFRYKIATYRDSLNYFFLILKPPVVLLLSNRSSLYLKHNNK